MKTLFPNDWRLAPLKQVVDKNRPITYGIVQAGPHIEDGIPYIRVSDMTKGRLTLDGMLRTSKEIALKYKRSTVLENDIVFALRGVAGSVLKVPSELSGANLTQGTARIAPSNEVISNYLVYAIGSSLVQRDIEKRLKGSTFKEISLTELEKIKIPIPPLSEQQKIAETLAYWDEAITKTERLIVVLRARKKSLIQRLLTGQVRFPGFEAQWKEIQMGKLVKEVRRPIEWDDSATYNLISVRRRSGGLFLREQRQGSEIKTKNMNIALAGDFLISKMQIVHGASGLTTQEFNGMHISGSYISLIAQESKTLDIRFFDLISKTPYFYQLTYLSSYGVHIEKMTFNLKDFLKRTINIPSSLEEQKKIIVIFEAAEKEIKLAEQKLEALKQQKRGLMQKLLTGQIRVKVE